MRQFELPITNLYKNTLIAINHITNTHKFKDNINQKSQFLIIIK